MTKVIKVTKVTKVTKMTKMAKVTKVTKVIKVITGGSDSGRLRVDAASLGRLSMGTAQCAVRFSPAVSLYIVMAVTAIGP